ncbi:Glyoxalase-like domain-containing protein [Parasphingorhabdus marina DSM 22363]|uniref:Glyoxalase-like domain-containing protein n=1 Tax=Parasphingorhabdus marina DSM 22363 TaxID=1123272 RepID=A0A1N6HAZ5_9SPHN|nr:VOC family protein [Parasphingorhabdus marina]SIO16926.1 Glyoxalase-like domain-containing protein [Parasphingorhabdus marina DSM 22363]
MIAYTMLGTNDKEKAFAFYDSLFEGTDIKRLFKTPLGGQFYGKVPGQPMLCITSPYDEGEACFGNGTMVALQFEDTADIDRLHAKALEIGGKDEGEPGWRAPEVFYGAYFRDLDGNKLCVCKMNMGG